MSKKADLASALQTQDEEEQGGGVVEVTAEEQPKPLTEPAKKKAKPAASGANYRGGKSNISGWFPDNVKFELEELRLQLSRKAGRKIPLQDIMAEAYNDLFKKHGRAEIAPKPSHLS